MAKVRFGPAIADARGSTNGVVFSRNRFGAYTRARVSPVQPRTPAQVSQRENLIQATTAWRSLTDAQRADWATLGEQIVRSNTLGEVYRLTGLQAFVLSRAITERDGDPPLVDAPPLPVIPSFEIVSVIWSAGSGLTVLQVVPGVPGTDQRYRVWTAAQRSPGRSYVGRHEYRLIFVGDAGGGFGSAELAAITNAHNARWGFPNAGQFLPLLIDVVSTSGIPGSEQRHRVIVVP